MDSQLIKELMTIEKIKVPRYGIGIVYDSAFKKLIFTLWNYMIVVRFSGTLPRAKNIHRLKRN